MFLFISIKGWNETWAIVLPMFMVSLANGSSLSLSVSGAISGEHRNFATASGLVGFFQIGSAALMAMGISATFGTNIFVLAGAIMAFSLIALISCITLLKEKLPRSV
ncbi:multidrug effflux MFS transporter [Salmonella enterica subsp. enterica]|nr:multidrug effflux MFS transporter [Salmonella enterica subsp. enterica serovar Hvittingfoss]EEJ7167031.1 multidrug effflux MFS transporter [Salmonella enterica subsp. enterica serovar Hvittingfoss]